MFHISAAALLLVHPRFSLEVSGKHHLASGRELMVGPALLHCLLLGAL